MIYYVAFNKHIGGVVMNKIKSFWKFLGFFQPPFLRSLHALAAILVVLQFISSFIMSKNAPDGVFAYFSFLYHIEMGIILLFISVFFIAYSFNLHGPRHFFPYLWGDVAQVKKDVKTTLRFKLAAPRSGGLAAAVQGLGLGALFLAAGSGAAWYAAVFLQAQSASGFLSFHKAIVILIALYFIGHGTMAILHFFLFQKNIAKKAAKSA